MFCSRCGKELADDARFCSKCGHPVKVQKANVCTACGAELEEGTNFCRKCGTPVGGVVPTLVPERFSFDEKRLPDLDSDKVRSYSTLLVGASGLAPAVFAALLFLYSLLRGFTSIFFSLSSRRLLPTITRFLGRVLGFFSVVSTIFAVVVIAALVYLYLTKQAEINKMFLGSIANAAALLLVSVMYYNMRFGLVLGIVLFVPIVYLGLCVAYVVFLKKEDLSGEIDFRIFDDIKYYLQKSEEGPDPSQYTDPKIVEYENTETIEELDSYFDGTGLQLFGYILLLILVSALTCGIMAPWGLKKIYKWKNEHTVIEGNRLSFNGTAMGLFGKWIKNYILTAITCGIYSFFAYVDLKKWEVKHCTFTGHENQSESDYVDSYFDGNSFENFGYQILMVVGSLLTCFLMYPYFVSIYYKWHAKHTVYHGNRLFYDGKSGMIFLNILLIIVLTLLTCGLYLPWGVVRINKYLFNHTHIDAKYRGPDVITKDVNSQVF